MKSITNTRCLVLWGLLAFYLFFIVSYYLSKFSEGLDTGSMPTVSEETLPTPTVSGNIAGNLATNNITSDNPVVNANVTGQLPISA